MDRHGASGDLGAVVQQEWHEDCCGWKMILPGGPADETVRFDSAVRRMRSTLSRTNAATFRTGLAPFIEHAHRAGLGRIAGLAGSRLLGSAAAIPGRGRRRRASLSTVLCRLGCLSARGERPAFFHRTGAADIWNGDG